MLHTTFRRSRIHTLMVGRYLVLARAALGSLTEARLPCTGAIGPSDHQLAIQVKCIAQKHIDEDGRSVDRLWEELLP